MIRHLIASAAVFGLIVAMQPAPAAAQTSTTTTQPAKPAAKKPATKSAAKKPAAKKSMASAKPAKGSNRKLDNIADKLNACQAKPMGERQNCMDAATKS
jgi:hypothetical protein